MSTAQEISPILMDKVADWLNQSALAGNDLETLVKGFCERLAAAGLPLKRVHLSFSMLHPLYDALGFTWLRGQGMEIESFRNRPGVPSDRFLASPYYHLLSNQLEHLRRRLDPSVQSEFPVFDPHLERANWKTGCQRRNDAPPSTHGVDAPWAHPRNRSL